MIRSLAAIFAAPPTRHSNTEWGRSIAPARDAPRNQGAYKEPQMSVRGEMSGGPKAGKRLRVRSYESVDDAQELLPAWDALLSNFPSATIFSTWEWSISWWRAYGHGQRLMILGFFDTNENLVALAPLSLSVQGVSRTLGIGILRLMGDGSGDSDNLDFPVLPGYEKEFVRALLEYLEAQASCWDVCQFNTMPDQSPAGNELLNQLRQRGWPHFSYRTPHLAISLPDSWESYLKQISSNERHKLGRYLRRLEQRYQVQFDKCCDASQLDRCLEDLFRLHQKRWQLQGDSGSFGSYARRQFYAEISHLLLARGWLEFWLLGLDGKTVAAEFSMRYSQTAFALQQGYDPEYSADNLMYVLRGHVLKQLITAGVRRYDFLAGQASEKIRWGTQPGTYLDIHFSKAGIRGGSCLRLIRDIKKTKEWLRGRLPKRAWQALRRLTTQLRGA